MTPEEKVLAVIETILELAAVQIREKPELKNSCSLFVQEVIGETLTNVPPDDIRKIIRKLDRLGIIQNPQFAPEAFICYDSQKLIDYRNKLVKSTDGEQAKIDAGIIKKNKKIAKELHEKSVYVSRNIFFNEETGAVFVRNSYVGEVKPHAEAYFLFKILWEHYPHVVDYETISKYIYDNKKKKIETLTRSHSNYCQTLKSAIKKKFPKMASLIDKFKTGEGKRGYRLIDPEHQKIARN